MIDRFHQWAKRYGRSGVFLDTNLFMLLAVGTFDPTTIGKFKRTTKYDIEAFELLKLLLEPFSTIITSPHVLAEVSNLSGNSGDHFEQAYFDLLIKQVEVMNEIHLPSQDVVHKTEFLDYGLTDTAIKYIAANKYLIFTDDLRLYRHLVSDGIDALNFTLFRQSYLLS